MLDRGDEHTCIGCRDREADASLVARGNSRLQLLPRGAAIGCLVDRAARTAAVESERTAKTLIGRGVECVRIAWIHRDVRRARQAVDVKELVPRPAAVHGLVDAAIGGRLPEI